MLLIIEGPDGAGKTTLARGFGGAYHHEGPPPPGVNLFQYYCAVVRTVHSENRRRTTVFDRLALSETVYGPIMRGGSRVSKADYQEFLAATRAYGAIHVLCLPPFPVALENWRRNRGAEYVADEGKFRQVYEAFALASPSADLVYDYTRGGRP
jgi:hypothetical protein